MSVSDTIFPGLRSGARAAGDAAVDAVTSIMPKPEQPAAAAAAPLPPAHPDNSEADAERAAAAEEERRRSQYGRASTNPTGGAGLLAPAFTAAKSLLGY